MGKSHDRKYRKTPAGRQEMMGHSEDMAVLALTWLIISEYSFMELEIHMFNMQQERSFITLQFKIKKVYKEFITG